MSEICKNNCQNPYNICYDNYLNTNACTECTGLICTPAKDNDEWESYRKIFDFIPEPPESNIPPPSTTITAYGRNHVQTNDLSEVLSVL